jgi:hypothetical protein
VRGIWVLGLMMLLLVAGLVGNPVPPAAGQVCEIPEECPLTPTTVPPAPEPTSPNNNNGNGNQDGGRQGRKGGRHGQDGGRHGRDEARPDLTTLIPLPPGGGRVLVPPSNYDIFP